MFFNLFPKDLGFHHFLSPTLRHHTGPPVLAKKRYFDVQTDGWAEEQVMVQLDSEPFGKGGGFRTTKLDPNMTIL